MELFMTAILLNEYVVQECISFVEVSKCIPLFREVAGDPL
jgi:hypothetical protein